MPTSANGLLRWTNAVATFPAKMLFDNAVFQRVEGDDRQPPAGLEGCYRLGEHILDPVQFLIYCDAQGLERLRSGVDVASTR